MHPWYDGAASQEYNVHVDADGEKKGMEEGDAPFQRSI